MSHLIFKAYYERGDMSNPHRNNDELFDHYFDRINKGEWSMSCRTPPYNGSDSDLYSYFLMPSSANETEFAVVGCLENHPLADSRVGEHKTMFDSIRIFVSEQDAIKYLQAISRLSTDYVFSRVGEAVLP